MDDSTAGTSRKKQPKRSRTAEEDPTAASVSKRHRPEQARGSSGQQHSTADRQHDRASTQTRRPGRQPRGAVVQRQTGTLFEAVPVSAVPSEGAQLPVSVTAALPGARASGADAAAHGNRKRSAGRVAEQSYTDQLQQQPAVAARRMTRQQTGLQEQHHSGSRQPSTAAAAAAVAAAGVDKGDGNCANNSSSSDGSSSDGAAEDSSSKDEGSGSDDSSSNSEDNSGDTSSSDADDNADKDSGLKEQIARAATAAPRLKPRQQRQRRQQQSGAPSSSDGSDRSSSKAATSGEDGSDSSEGEGGGTKVRGQRGKQRNAPSRAARGRRAQRTAAAQRQQQSREQNVQPATAAGAVDDDGTPAEAGISQGQKQPYIHVKRAAENAGWDALVNVGEAAQRSQVRGTARSKPMLKVGRYRTPYSAAVVADLAQFAVLGVHTGMKLNFPLNSYTEEERQKRSSVDLMHYLKQLKGIDYITEPDALQEGGTAAPPGSTKAGGTVLSRAVKKGLLRRGGVSAASAAAARERRCGLCTGCVSGKNCVVAVWRRKSAARNAATAAPAVASAGAKSSKTAAMTPAAYAKAAGQKLEVQYWKMLALQHPEANHYVTPMRPAAAAVAAAPAVAAAAREAAAAATAPSGDAAPAASRLRRSTRSNAAAAAAEAATLSARAAVNSTLQIPPAAFLGRYGGIPVERPVPHNPRWIRFKPPAAPRIKYDTFLTTAAAAADAGFGNVQIDLDRTAEMHVCIHCMSIQHAVGPMTKALCPVHKLAAEAAEPAEDEQPQWMEVLGHEGVELVGALRDMADNILPAPVTQPKKQQKNETATDTDVPEGLSSKSGIDPWTFVAAAVLLEEVGRAMLEGQEVISRV